MTGREVCARYQIPMKVLQEYERRGLCGAVRMDEYDTIFLVFPIWLAYHKLIQCTQIA